MTNRRKEKTTVSGILLSAAASLLAGAMLWSCHSPATNPNKNITKDQFNGFINDSYTFDLDKIRSGIMTLVENDDDSTQTDIKTRKLYRKGTEPIWVNRYGIDSRADTLLKHLKDVGRWGFSEKAFYTQELENDIRRLRTLDFDNREHTINNVAARLEYRLTKAYLRYCTGQRFGYTDPFKSLNNLDLVNPDDTTSRRKNYRQLFDIPIERPDNRFYQAAVSVARGDSLAMFLNSVQPRDTELEELRLRLANTSSGRQRWLLLCNMERRRWRRQFTTDTGNGKKVVVNIPSFMLLAYSHDSLMTMKVGCGSTKTKTPLLTSQLSRMDFNPLWNIPMSIIKNDVAKHAGNAAYFDSHRYFIVERNTGKRIDPRHVTANMLKSGHYRVSQEGGEGNSLGRIIFRFDNKFSVYLHDTSSRHFFNQTTRSVSHGCIRVERPFDLAKYLLNDTTDQWDLDKMRITMGLDPATEKGQKYVSDTTKTRKLVHSRTIEPKVPLYIIYQTLYKMPDGRWEQFGDIYGYDAIMKKQLMPFVERTPTHRNQ